MEACLTETNKTHPVLDLDLAELVGVPERAREHLRDLGETTAVKAAWRFMTSPISNLVLSGQPGCGKTVALGLATCEVGQRFDPPRSRSPKYCTVRQLQRVSWFDAEQQDGLERAAVLAIDELGTESIGKTGEWLSHFEGLLCARHERKLKTIMATNLGAEAFRQRYGMRIWDRLQGEAGHFLTLSATSDTLASRNGATLKRFPMGIFKRDESVPVGERVSAERIAELMQSVFGAFNEKTP